MSIPVDARLARAAFARSLRDGEWYRRAALHLALALPVMVLGIWASTGSLAPYSATHAPRELLACGYTANIDHVDFQSVYWMLKGYPVSEWGESIALRRLLYYVLGYPFFQTFGFYLGGVAFNVLVTALTLAGFSYFVFRHVGRGGSVVATWLLATYPGITYWAGLPYAHAMIVPATVAGFVLLHALARPRRLVDHALIGLGLGALCQAYDLIVYFGPAGLALSAWFTRRPAAPVVLLAALAVPFAVTYGLLVLVFEVPSLTSSNTAAFGAIAGAYPELLRGEVDLAAWWSLLAGLPAVLWAVFLNGNFVVLPLLFAALLVLGTWAARVRMHPASLALIGAIALLALFNNLAPPYEGWQMRGEWIVRLYQPLFAPFMFFAARAWRAIDLEAPGWRPLAGALVVVAALGQAMVVYGGPIANGALTNYAYTRFYLHNGVDGYRRHVETFGRRPLGFCLPPGEQTWAPLKRVDD